VKLLFSSLKEKPERWIPLLEQALPQDRITTEPGADVDIALVATPLAGLFARLPNLKLVQSLWMGVELLLEDPALPRHVPLARLIDPGMVHAMAETVIAHLLDWHRHHYYYRQRQQEGRWSRREQQLPSDRTVGLFGLGELGAYAAQRLVALGFNVRGWSRRPKAVPGVACSTDLDEVLRSSDAIVCLLPLTPQTRGVLSARAFALMPKGGCVINVARGPHVVVADLLAALDSGHLAHAYLDVFDLEPLPAGSPLWNHRGITLTPHIAALNDPRTSVPKIVENVERVRRGEQPAALVDFAAGY
jgi:glyoxylate/hydroxypyruvate reductase A